MTSEQISALCNNMHAYLHAEWLARTGRVRDVQKVNRTSIRASVQDFYLRLRVELTWDTDRLDHAECNCNERSASGKVCSHIAAVLLHVSSPQQIGAISVDQGRDKGARLLQMLHPLVSPDVREVQVEYTLTLSDSSCSLSMRVGDGRMYVVRDIGDFLSAIRHGLTVPFGKQFQYTPERYGFSEADREIMMFLRENVGNTAHRWYTNSAAQRRYVYLPSSDLTRLMHVLSKRPFLLQMTEGGHAERIEPAIDGLPHMEFELDNHGEEIEMHFQSRDIQLFTEDAQYLVQGKRLFRLTPEQAMFALPFFTTAQDAFDDRYIFSTRQLSEFVGVVLPRLGGLGELHIHPELEKRIERHPLSSKVFLDMDAQGLVARVEFHYGETVIEPWTAQKPSATRVLMRDATGEQAVMAHFERAHFTVRPDGAHLVSHDALYAFFSQGMQALGEVAELYATNAVRSVEIRRSKPFGRVGLSGGLLSLQVLLEDAPDVDPEMILDALRARKRYIRIPSGAFVELDLDGWDDVIDVLATSSQARKDGNVELPLYHIHGFSAWAKGLQLDLDEQLLKLVSGLANPTMEPTAQTKDVMRPYQLTGFRWMAALTDAGMGGVLADDMGLGKTLQVIALVDWARERSGQLPSLVVCPTTLMFNWRAEAQKFAPNLRVCVLDGTPAQRRKAASSFKKYDLVITSYPLLRRDVDFISEQTFRYCILDEAQAIKNTYTANAQSVKQIRSGARLALTGTPMENNLSELWSIFDFVLPGYLLSQTSFLEKYEGGAVDLLYNRIRPFLLRRLKKEVLAELPDKIEQTFRAEMTEEQRKIYDATLSKLRGEVDQEIAHAGPQSRFTVLTAITRLRQICCHPGLCFEDYGGGSGKLELLMELIEESLSAGHQILLFSQFTSMLQLIRKALQARDISLLYLDGHTPPGQREQLVQAFNDGGAPIFLISLKAGGTGLNLTRADTVIHFDPWWNPAVEDQATDRAHRIGQKRVVQVIRLIAGNSIEERIQLLKSKKQELIDQVIGQSEGTVAKITLEELRSLFDPIEAEL